MKLCACINIRSHFTIFILTIDVNAKFTRALVLYNRKRRQRYVYFIIFFLIDIDTKTFHTFIIFSFTIERYLEAKLYTSVQI